MRTIATLFGRSPFVPVQHHMERVATAADQLPATLNAYLGGDQQQVEQLAEQITAAEEAADQMRRDIQRTIKKGIFLAVERSRMVKMVSLQDRLADKAGNVARLLTLKPCHVPPPFASEVRSLVATAIEAFAAVRKIIDELDELLESSFGGPEAQLVQLLVRDVQQREREADAAPMRPSPSPSAPGSRSSSSTA
jgi:hypothetical protein